MHVKGINFLAEYCHYHDSDLLANNDVSWAATIKCEGSQVLGVTFELPLDLTLVRHPVIAVSFLAHSLEYLIFPIKRTMKCIQEKRLLCLNDFPPEKWQTQTKQDTVIPSHLCMCFHLVITEILWELVLTATHHMIWGMFFFFFFKKKMCGVNLWGTIFKQNRWLHSCFKIISLDPSPLQMDSHNCTHSGFGFFFLTSEAQCHVKLCFRV